MPTDTVTWSDTFEGYMMFRMSEPINIHVQHWTEASANPEYEKWLLAEYDRQFS